MFVICAARDLKLQNHYLFLRRKKFEIATDEVGNFIKQDEKKGVLREVSVEVLVFVLFQSTFRRF